MVLVVGTEIVFVLCREAFEFIAQVQDKERCIP